MTSGLEKIKNKLGANMRKYRKILNLTQFELGVQADISEHYVQLMEKGKSTPSMAVLGKLADALKVEPYELLK